MLKSGKPSPGRRKSAPASPPSAAFELEREPAPAPLTYKDSGVDQHGKDEAIDEILHLMRRTHSPRVLDIPWGFAGLFALKGRDRLFQKPYRNPVLMACADGVGTKLRLAFALDRHDTVGIDLVAMNVNDLIVHGGEPLFFLDYIATGKVERKTLLRVVRGIVAGCEKAGCALLGGETAEMPDSYPPGEYDLAGFAVGVAEKNSILDGSRVAAGDVVLGLASDGLHSNGYSLVRKILERNTIDLRSHSAELGGEVGEVLMRPTRIYVRPVRELLARTPARRLVKALAHITGGGMGENIPRVLPKGLTVEIREGTWPVPPVFPWLQRLGGVARDEMYRVFNMGIGMVLVLDRAYAGSVAKKMMDAGEKAYTIGRIVQGGSGGVRICPAS